MSLKSDIRAIAKEFESGKRHNAEGTRFGLGTESDEGLQLNETKRVAAQFEQRLKQAATAKPAPVIGKIKPAAPILNLYAQAPEAAAPAAPKAAPRALPQVPRPQIDADEEYARQLQAQYDAEARGFRPAY